MDGIVNSLETKVLDCQDFRAEVNLQIFFFIFSSICFLKKPKKTFFFIIFSSGFKTRLQGSIPYLGWTPEGRSFSQVVWSPTKPDDNPERYGKNYGSIWTLKSNLPLKNYSETVWPPAVPDDNSKRYGKIMAASGL